MTTTLLLWLLALAAGTLIPVQAAANAVLSKSIHGNVPFAALTLFVVAGATTVAAFFLSAASSRLWRSCAPPRPGATSVG